MPDFEVSASGNTFQSAADRIDRSSKQVTTMAAHPRARGLGRSLQLTGSQDAACAEMFDNIESLQNPRQRNLKLRPVGQMAFTARAMQTWPDPVEPAAVRSAPFSRRSTVPPCSVQCLELLLSGSFKY